MLLKKFFLFSWLFNSFINDLPSNIFPSIIITFLFKISKSLLILLLLLVFIFNFLKFKNSKLLFKIKLSNTNSLLSFEKINFCMRIFLFFLIERSLLIVKVSPLLNFLFIIGSVS